MDKGTELLRILSVKLKNLIRTANLDYEKLQELRLRVDEPFIIVCNYSLYAYEDEIRQGFITIQSGHRVGIAGKVVMENGKIIATVHGNSIDDIKNKPIKAQIEDIVVRKTGCTVDKVVITTIKTEN